MYKDYIKFLIEAKQQTYANENIEKVESSRKGSKDYEYTNGTFTYHDTYFGGIKFIGEEVIYSDSKIPIWAMNYYGVTLDENLSEETMDMALRPALMKVGEDEKVLPVRGPSEFINGEYIYKFTSNGNIEDFEGIEEIYKSKKLIYRLKCHGGIIK